jgi:type I restriction enzyme S subunit
VTIPTVPLFDVAVPKGLIGGPFGSSLVNNDYEPSGVPVIRGTNLGFGRRLGGDYAFVSEEKVASDLARNTATPGDIVFTQRGTLGQVALVPDDTYPVFVVSQSQMRLRVDPAKAVSKYVYYACASEAFMKQIDDNAISTGVPHINLGILNRLTIPLPPLPEQRAVAEVLGALDDKIAANTKLASTASDLAGLVFDQATANLGIQPMSEVLSPVLGGTPQRSRADFWGGTQLWASAKDITGADFGVITDTNEKITQMAVSTSKAKPLPAGSVILTARGTVGAVARLAAPSSFNQSCYGFVPGTVPPGVLYFAVRRATQRAKEIAHGSVFDTITMKTFDHLPFPKFDDAAFSSAEGRIGPLLDAVAGSVIENAKLASTRNALLPQLMSGKVRVKDAETVLEEAGV